jgi:dihydropteroate synthase
VTTTQNKIWQVGQGRLLKLDGNGIIMAIVNVTPDSFSDGGQYASSQKAIDHALKCIDDGAHILDIGGESTRPGADPVTAQEEQARVIPVIEALAKRSDVLISIDTYRASTAELALKAGAHIVNDVHGLQREPQIANVVSSARAGLCIMHTGRDREKLPDLIDDQKLFFDQSLATASSAGIDSACIVLDPGFGFAKDTQEDVELMARFSELHALGYPILAGTSRKRTMGALTGRHIASERDVATNATTALLRMAGAVIFRVHNVAATRDTLCVVDAVLNAAPRRKSGDLS